MTTSSTPKITQKQYTTTPRTTVTTSPQTSVMKHVGTSVSQNSNKNQNWRGSGNKTTTTSTGASTSTLVTTSGKNGVCVELAFYLRLFLLVLSLLVTTLFPSGSLVATK